MASSIFITGANRGIGLGLVKEFLKVTSLETIIAGARNPSAAAELNALKDPRLHIVQIDVSDDVSIQNAFSKVQGIVGSKGLNVLLNNAGVLTPYPVAKPSRADLLANFDVNTFSATIVTQTFLPLLQQASKANSSVAPSASRAAIVTISSILGSNGVNNGSGPKQYLAYRMSKAAINMLASTLAIDLKEDGIIAVNFHPGWVATDMGGSEAPVTVEGCVVPLSKSILSITEEHNGKLWQRDLSPIPY